MRDLSDIVLKPSDFPSLAAICRLDPQFPVDWSAWIALIETANKQARERNLFPPSLLLEPSKFQEWCTVVGIIPGIDALRAFAIIQRERREPRGLE